MHENQLKLGKVAWCRPTTSAWSPKTITELMMGFQPNRETDRFVRGSRCQNVLETLESITNADVREVEGNTDYGSL